MPQGRLCVEDQVAEGFEEGLKNVFIEGKGESQREFFGMMTGLVVPYAAGKALGYGARLAVGIGKNWSSIRAGASRAGDMFVDMVRRLPTEVRGSFSWRRLPNTSGGLKPIEKSEAWLAGRAAHIEKMMQKSATQSIQKAGVAEGTDRACPRAIGPLRRPWIGRNARLDW